MRTHRDWYRNDKLIVADTFSKPDPAALETALRTILDCIDYTLYKCKPNEMVGAVLPAEVLRLAHEALESEA